jgi:hypothetical protein
MTTFTTQSLLTDVVYGTASGNYDGSSQNFYSDAVTAANYYGGQGSLQTITYRLQNFVGTITIEASLDDLTDQARWFEIDTWGDGSEIITGTHPVSVTGNFVWVRARIQGFDDGTIQAVTISY